jgi:hypothetical protein
MPRRRADGPFCAATARVGPGWGMKFHALQVPQKPVGNEAQGKYQRISNIREFAAVFHDFRPEIQMYFHRLTMKFPVN